MTDITFDELDIEYDKSFFEKLKESKFIRNILKKKV
jgi:hypothetical protein